MMSFIAGVLSFSILLFFMNDLRGLLSVSKWDGLLYFLCNQSCLILIDHKEVVGLISGTYSLEQCEYISHISSLIGKQSKETLVQIAVEGTYMIKTPPVDDILNCIKKKNALYSTYDETLDEIWLLIYIPTNENHYSTKGISTLEGIETEFKRIYISDWRLRGRLIYEQ